MDRPALSDKSLLNKSIVFFLADIISGSYSSGQIGQDWWRSVLGRGLVILSCSRDLFLVGFSHLACLSPPILWSHVTLSFCWSFSLAQSWSTSPITSVRDYGSSLSARCSLMSPAIISPADVVRLNQAKGTCCLRIESWKGSFKED